MGRLRIASARFMIRLGKLIQALAMFVMRSEDLIEFSRRTYAQPARVANWCRPDVVDEGLFPDELALLERSPVRCGRLLLLDLGGGREAIPLGKRGFTITGIDFVAGMVVQAKANAARHGVPIEGLIQEISKLDMPPGTYDLVWLSARMYSSIPTKQRRVGMLRRIAGALRGEGCFICQFDWSPTEWWSPDLLRISRPLAWLTGGYVQFEPGDVLWHGAEFIHRFADEKKLIAEFTEGGFEVLHLDISAENMIGGAVLQKTTGKAL